MGNAKTALERAQWLGDQAGETGFDWERAEDALKKVSEEVEEVRQALERRDVVAIEDELGDLLFAAAMVARKAGVAAEGALERANEKFQRRFEGVERMLIAAGSSLEEATLEEMEDMWQRIKRAERVDT
ncbi:MAG: MazG nucleotide pyrophosphohydrolase domain-containing protein [Myxococcota bacterium]